VFGGWYRAAQGLSDYVCEANRRLAGVDMSRLALLIAGISLVAGCENSCQNLCVQMADYSADCGRVVSDSELQTCINEQSSAASDELQACRDFGLPDVVRRQWTCDDLNLYRDL
jgi:hypothetical protein